MRTPDFHKAGLFTLRGDRMLLCRKKRGKHFLILPGGKIEPGETEVQCLLREVREELGSVRVDALEFIGTYRDRAASGGPKIVQIELYRGDLIGTPVASSEIGELVWFGPSDDWNQLAPSLANLILPDLVSRGLLPWAGRAGAAT